MTLNIFKNWLHWMVFYYSLKKKNIIFILISDQSNLSINFNMYTPIFMNYLPLSSCFFYLVRNFLFSFLALFFRKIVESLNNSFYIHIGSELYNFVQIASIISPKFLSHQKFTTLPFLFDLLLIIIELEVHFNVDMKEF